MMFFFWGGVIFPSFIFGYFCWLPTRARVILTAHQGPTPVRGAPLRRWPEENNTTRRSASRSSNLGVVRRSRSCHPPRSAMGWYHGRKKHIRGGVLRAIPTWKTCIYIYIHDQNSYCIYIYITMQISMSLLVYSFGAHFLFSSKVVLSCLCMLQRTMLLNHILFIFIIRFRRPSSLSCSEVLSTILRYHNVHSLKKITIDVIFIVRERAIVMTLEKNRFTYSKCICILYVYTRCWNKSLCRCSGEKMLGDILKHPDTWTKF